MRETGALILMATTWTDQQLADLEGVIAALAGGASEVQYGDKRVRYHDLESLMKLRDRMATALSQKKNGSGAKRSYFAHSKGFK